MIFLRVYAVLGRISRVRRAAVTQTDGLGWGCVAPSALFRRNISTTPTARSTAADQRPALGDGGTADASHPGAGSIDALCGV